MVADIRWVTAVLGNPSDSAGLSGTFWAGVTGFGLARDPHDPDRTVLTPGAGDPYLAVTRLGRHSALAVHVELATGDPASLAARAESLGAGVRAETAAAQDAWVATTPAGLDLVIRRGSGGRRPRPSRQPGGRTTVDQLCVDVPPQRHAAEIGFWGGLTGWPFTGTGGDAEFTRLARPEGIPLAVLLQRLDEDQPSAGAHLDLACDDRDAETRRHERLGASVVRRNPGWTVLADPSGRAYCITTRPPGAV